ncbi:hypothetical protein [Xylanimonas ulmi]|uniref:Uncharacterized protein n=1 Tax=Xylanimonas ulmi TaxID=228973 RepID=A0A4Q7M3T5_9MICO|nr:hypothetical protein [Xylanibacterium ulmi]RZS62204.1 hypothetical protein EV386_2525 [Xylanibacterium ulmi]
MNSVLAEFDRIARDTEHTRYQDAASLCVYAHTSLTLAREASRAARRGDPAGQRVRVEGMRRVDTQLDITAHQAHQMDPAAAAGVRAAIAKAERAAAADNLTQYAACALEAAEEIWRYYARRISETLATENLAAKRPTHTALVGA